MKLCPGHDCTVLLKEPNELHLNISLSFELWNVTTDTTCSDARGTNSFHHSCVKKRGDEGRKRRGSLILKKSSRNCFLHSFARTMASFSGILNWRSISNLESGVLTPVDARREVRRKTATR